MFALEFLSVWGILLFMSFIITGMSLKELVITALAILSIPVFVEMFFIKPKREKLEKQIQQLEIEEKKQLEIYLENARRDHKNRIEELTTTNSRLIRENKELTRENAHLIVERDDAKRELKEMKEGFAVLNPEERKKLGDAIRNLKNKIKIKE